MCIIIFDNRTKDQYKLSKDVLERCQEKNPHGMGIMWANNGKLHTYKTMENFGGIWSRYCNARHQSLQVAIHFRKGTAGSDNSIENVHPFKIGPGFAFMHNGTMKDLTPFLDKGVSDTNHFNTHLLQRLPAGFLNEPTLRITVKGMLEGGRLFFMDSKGNFSLMNEDRWGAKWKDGVWWSKGDLMPFYLYKTDVKVYTTCGLGYGGGSWTSEHEQLPWKDKREQELRDKATGAIASATKKLTAGKKLTRGEKKAVKREAKRREKERKAGSLLERVRNMGKAQEDNPVKLIRDITPAVTGPVPSKSANLVFDYGFMMRNGYFDERMVMQDSPTMLYGAQLWALGQFGDEIPAAIATKGSAIIGTLYEIHTQQKAVLDCLDARYGCDIENPEASVYYRRYCKVASNKGDVYAWVYRYAMPIESSSSAAVVPFGDWSRWSSKHNNAPQVDVGTLIVKKLIPDISYECPLCSKSTKTELVLVWADRSDYILNCGSCGSKSMVYETDIEGEVS